MAIKLEVTVHYLDDGLVTYTGKDVYLDTNIKCFVLEKDDDTYTLIPLSSVRYIKTPKPYWIKKGK